MDRQRFEALARSVAVASSRRGVVRSAGGAALLGLLAGLSIGDIDAKKKRKPKKKKCKKGCDRCALEHCQRGKCGCQRDFRRMNGVCGLSFDCLSAGLITPSNSQCCSLESFFDPVSGQERCLPGTVSCNVPSDCINGGLCRGFMCPEHYEFTVGPGC